MITAVTYAPMQLALDAQATITGEASYRDPDGDTHQMIIGFLDPKGALSEASPYDTGTSGRLIADVVFSLTLTPKQVGIYHLSVRFVDDAGLSSEPDTEPFDVQ